MTTAFYFLPLQQLHRHCVSSSRALCPYLASFPSWLANSFISAVFLSPRVPVPKRRPSDCSLIPATWGLQACWSLAVLHEHASNAGTHAWFSDPEPHRSTAHLTEPSHLRLHHFQDATQNSSGGESRDFAGPVPSVLTPVPVPTVFRLSHLFLPDVEELVPLILDR